MIYVQTKVSIADNSGAIYGRCIRVLSSIAPGQRKWGKTGDQILLVVTRAQSQSGDSNLKFAAIKRKEILRAIIIRTTKEHQTDNAVVIISNSNTNPQNLAPRATRIKGVVGQTLRPLRKLATLVKTFI